LRRIVQGLVLASVPLILVILNQLLAREFDNVRMLAQEVERAQVTREQLKTILSVHQDLETGEVGFAATGDTEFLEPYVAAGRRVDAELARLGGLVAGDPVLRERMGALRRLSQEKRALSDQVVRLSRDGERRNAMDLIASRRGKAIMDGLRSQVAEMEQVVQRQLDASSLTRIAARIRTQRVAFAFQALLVMMLIVAAWMTARSLRAQRRAADRYRDLSARQEAVFDAATDGLILHDSAGIIDSVNPAMARLYGYEPRELVGRHIEILFENPLPRAQMAAFLRSLARAPRDGVAPIREFASCRKDGSAFPVDVATSPVMLGDGTFFLSAIRDATERKRVEQMKDEFVSTVSHELRTPLTSIAGSLGLLGGGAAGPLPEKAARLIQIAHSNSERLVRLINDILDIEKIESGKMAFQLGLLRLAPAIDQAVQANRGFATQHGVELDLGPVPEDAAVVADEDRLIQVITNLLSNAVKFSPPGETVRIWATSTGDTHRITVSDRGPGIPDAFRPHIFGKFAQADSSDSRAKTGTGLGLSIAREIVTRLGGAITFESTMGKGTSFHVDLPAAGREAPRNGESGQEAASALPQILHVDDDPDMLRVVASAFEGRAEIHSTPSVREGHAALRRQRFDAAILDVAMSDGSGLDLLPLLREEGARTPAVLFTVHDSSPAYTSLVDAVLTKSRSTLDELVGTVLALVATARKD
jgi:PAS domain S-box-containing protein